MKRITYLLALLLVLTISDSFAQHHGGGNPYPGNIKDPSLAALLSIQPLPIDFGNFYSGNWERGIIYTTAELALFIPGIILLERNGWGWGMHNYSYNYYGTYDRTSWSTSERNQFYLILAGYVVVKVISAFDAGYSAREYNKHFSLGYDPQKRGAVLSLNIPLNY